jgi:YjbE family integral membrane protein
MNIAGLLAAGLGIVLVDLALSSDNALVIGAAASRLPAQQQRVAILWGGVGAVIFRILLTSVSTELLQVPLLQVLGGLVVLVIAIRLAMPDGGGKPRWQSRDERMRSAVLTIMVADITMSLDNILAIGALAAGNIALLAGGLVVSMLLLFVASAVVAVLIRRLWFLLDLAVLILGWTAARMIVQDQWLAAQIQALHLPTLGQTLLQGLIYGLCFAIVVVADVRFRLIPLYRRRAARSMAPATERESPGESTGAATGSRRQRRSQPN